MDKRIKPLLWILIIAGAVIITLVANHSVGEIHWLKNNFFPSSFTMEEAMQASIVELVKVTIIAIPVFTIIFICLFILQNFRK